MTEEQQPEELESLAEQMDEEQDELTRLQAELDEALRDREQYKNMAQRSQADLVNYRRRSAEELADARERANSQLLLRLLSVADDFGRALDHIPTDAAESSWVEGLLLVQRILQNVLEAEGLIKIETAIGQPFDATEQEAVFFEPDSEREEDTVVQVIRIGYRLREHVLRAAQVSVSRLAEPEPEAHQERDDNIQEDL
jgi:molecular chaperone GrpE